MPDPLGSLRGWAEVDRWRRAERERLLAARIAIRGAERERLRTRITGTVLDQVCARGGRVVGCYWPFRGEIDLRPLMEDLVAQGVQVALPVVVAREQPLVYRPWHPGIALERNALGIPVPATREIAHPDVVLAPLLGFDDDNYRLGLGGGYFDRTLAALDPRPWTIGVGFELARLATIHPQPHDVPLDAVATESRVCIRLRNAPARAPARHGSPRGAAAKGPG